MSGHSKWATIKRKKGAADAKRGQAFTRLANAIALAARDGADPATNFKLRLAIDKAKAGNMPTANIEKSIARGSGQLKGEQIAEIIYEGYGPGGTAILVQCVTDNRNRTYADVRTAFSKHGGNLAESGSVAFQFELKGLIQIEPSDLEAATLEAIDAGALDVEEDDATLTIYTEPKQLRQVQETLQQADYDIVSAELGYVAKQTITISDPIIAQKVLHLIEALEELDDVSATYSNFDIPAEQLEAIAG